MGAHTPGPWAVVRFDSGRRIEIVSRCERDMQDFREHGITYVIAERIGGRRHGERGEDRSEVQANARLIAAAPELLEALARLLENGDIRDAAGKGELAQARAAIAKAKGEQP